MANLTLTPASIVGGTNAIHNRGTAGETITAGQVVYKSASTKRIMLADSNSATAEVRAPVGIAANGGAVGQPIDYITAGDITMGAVLTLGIAYYLSDTPGAICPVADIGSGEYVVSLGIAKSTTVLALQIQNSGVAL